MNQANLELGSEKGKIIFMHENILEISIKHQGGHAILYLDILDMPFDIRQKIVDCDKEMLNNLKMYLNNYYGDTMIESLTLARGESWSHSHCWEEIFLSCGRFHDFIVKAKGKLIRLINAI